MNSWQNLYDVVLSRKETAQENSYTCYLFEQGLDKVLKKCGEESAEVIIAAKNGRKDDTINEIGDLLYHLTVLMAIQDITVEDIADMLNQRSQKIGNLKTLHQSNKES